MHPFDNYEYTGFNVMKNQTAVDLPKETTETQTKTSADITENKMIITLGLDGTKLQKDLEFYVQRELVEEMKNNVRKIMFTEHSGCTRYYSRPTKYDLNTWLIDLIKEIILECKDEIIQAAAKELADSMRRSKPVRERFCDILGEELQHD